MTRHVHNLSYNRLDAASVAILSRSGIIDRNTSWDSDSRLPYIGRDFAPEIVKEEILKLVQSIQIENDDIVIVGGVPDVSFYVSQFAPPTSPVLMVVVKRSDSGKNQVVGFREIIRGDRGSRPMKAIHVVVTK